MSEPTPRQVLYAMVAGGFLLVVAALVVGAALSGLVPMWWTLASGAGLSVLTVWSVLNWRRTAPVLLGAIGLFMIWAVGTLIVSA
ncbi:MAG: hypothetical protein ACRDZM_08295 [Acidimicrobiia bacterium]